MVRDLSRRSIGTSCLRFLSCSCLFELFLLPSQFTSKVFIIFKIFILFKMNTINQIKWYWYKISISIKWLYIRLAYKAYVSKYISKILLLQKTHLLVRVGISLQTWQQIDQNCFFRNLLIWSEISLEVWIIFPLIYQRWIFDNFEIKH